MARFKVTIREVTKYSVTVEAIDAADAADAAIEARIEGEGEFVSCDDRDAIYTAEVA